MLQPQIRVKTRTDSVRLAEVANEFVSRNDDPLIQNVLRGP